MKENKQKQKQKSEWLCFKCTKEVKLPMPFKNNINNNSNNNI